MRLQSKRIIRPLSGSTTGPGSIESFLGKAPAAWEITLRGRVRPSRIFDQPAQTDPRSCHHPHHGTRFHQASSVAAGSAGVATLYPMPWLFHHVQLAIPPESEAQAREFYRDALGCQELAKPATLVDRGGAWFRYGGVELHLGVEENHRPARQAHPGILVGDLDELEARLRAAGHEVETDYLLPGYRRLYVHDPFGNRLEFLAVL